MSCTWRSNCAVNGDTGAAAAAADAIGSSSVFTCGSSFALRTLSRTLLWLRSNLNGEIQQKSEENSVK
jgi:hypothetical protein